MTQISRLGRKASTRSVSLIKHFLSSKHVLSEDVIEREVVGNKLFTKRLLKKSGRLPRWGERHFRGLKYVYVVEESVVDLPAKTLTTYTRNIGKQQHIMVCLPYLP